MAHPPRNDSAPWRNFYGRRHGKRLRPGQERLLAERLSDLAPGPVSWADNPTRRALDLAHLFPQAADTWLEIGFGAGEHMLAMAQHHPTVGLIGCEPFINGVAMLLSAIERAGVSNLAIHPGDARDLLDVIPARSLGRVYLLYPDPWPKKRHWKRRFVSHANLDQLALAMRPGAELRIATDIPDYVRHSLEIVAGHEAFEWTATSAADWREPWPGWHSTRYEQKALREGRIPHYVRLRRR